MTDRDDDLQQHALWRFSVAHYREPGVATACLRLQDEHGLDVNVALACLWHERRGGAPLSSSRIRELLAATESLRARVLTIRGLRRSAKAQSEALYRALKRAELIAENLLQAQLHEALGPAAGEPGSGDASLRAYAEAAGVDLPPELTSALLAT